MMHNEHFKGLYAIVDDRIHAQFGLQKLLEHLVMDSKVCVIQLRLKQSTPQQKQNFVDTAIKLKLKRNFCLIVNDDTRFLNHPSVDGVHVGQDDGDFKTLRQLYPQKILGLSTHTFDEAILAEQMGANYIGCGCLFPTDSKANTQVLPWAELERITHAVRIPKVGIGGILPSNMQQAIDAGCNMVAMISGLVNHEQFVGHTIHNTLVKSA